MQGEYTSLFNDVVVIFLLAIVLLLILYRVKIPSIVAFLITGIIVGPSGLGLITNEDSIEFFAELGVVFLLFTIGLEFSISKILKSRRFVLIGGIIQVALTIAVVTALMTLTGWPVTHAFFWGMLVSLSSTAIVMKVLADRREVDSPFGKATLGILIFQDLIVIPMVMVTPLLAGSPSSGPSAINLLIGGFVIIAVVYVSARYVVPYLLHYAARLRNREMFLFIVIGTCLLVAFLTSEFGLSMALGAFLAGLIISESEYSSHAMYNIIPFRDLFSSFFFISIGMIFDLSSLLAQPGQILLFAAAIIAIKYLTGTAAGLLTGLPSRGAVLTGLALCQIGEFAFILSSTGHSLGLLDKPAYQLFLDVSIITMGISPLLIGISDRMTPHLCRPLERIVPPRPQTVEEEQQPAIQDHIIIVGYGLNGKNVARSAKIAGVPFRVIEMNPETVRDERKAGVAIMYGDAVQPGVLKCAGIAEARVLVVVVNDPFSIQEIVRVAREMNPAIYIIARTRFVGEVKTLLELGADEVIPEEFETSVEIFTRILHKYLLPADEIERFVAEIRASGYQMLRSLNTPAYTFDDLRMLVPDMDLRMIRLTETTPYAGELLKNTQMRSRYHVTVVAIRRGDRTIINPGGDEHLMAGDLLMVLGHPQEIATAFALKRKTGNPDGVDDSSAERPD